MNNSQQILIKNVREQLILREWSQSTLGEKAGVSQERISHLLNGKTEPTLLLLDKIADAFGITTVELLTDTPTPAQFVIEEKAPFQVERAGITFTKYGKIGKVKPIEIHIPNLDIFREDFIAFKFDESKPNSGTSNSYANYMEYILQNYYDNFGEILNPLDSKTPSKLEKLRESPNFKSYNVREGRFPNATIKAYNQFMKSINIDNYKE